MSYINISGTFYYLCSVLDGYSRSIVHWELRESMTEAEIEIMSKDGRRVWLEIRGHSIREGEQLVETFHIARDITKRKSAENESILY